MRPTYGDLALSILRARVRAFLLGVTLGFAAGVFVAVVLRG